MTVTTIQKITASIEVSSRYALGVSTIEATGTKADGGKKYTSIQWSIGTNYNAGKLVNFSLYYMEFTGKNKGQFTEALRLVPCLKSGFSLQFIVNNRVSIKDAVAKFIEPDFALTHVANLTLPVQFFILSAVFSRSEVIYPDNAENLVTVQAVDPSVWDEVKALTQAKLPQFFGLPQAVATSKAIADQPKITIPQITTGNTQDTVADTKESLQKECDTLGIAYRKNYGVSKLKELIASHSK